MKRLIGMILSSAALTAAALPEVSPESVTLAIDGATGRVTVGYELTGDPAVVTFDVTTNGVTIGGRHLWRVGGDVNRRLEPGLKSFTWLPDPTVSDPIRLDSADVRAVVTAWPTNNLPDYMVVTLGIPYEVSEPALAFYPDAEQLPGGATAKQYKIEKVVMRKVHAAGQTFRMGSPPLEAGREPSGCAYENVVYVSFTNDYYLGIYPLTRGQCELMCTNNWRTMCGGATGTVVTDWGGEDEREAPADGIDCNNMRGSTSAWPKPRDYAHRAATTFPCGYLSYSTHVLFDYPLDAEWEYAARAGESRAHYDGTTNAADVAELGWYGENAGGRPHAVGLKKPNAWGFYDLYGNVWERCHDFYTNYVAGVRLVSPTTCQGKSISNYDRIARGGAYNSSADCCRSACRGLAGHNSTTTYGCRLWAEAAIP